MEVFSVVFLTEWLPLWLVDRMTDGQAEDGEVEIANDWHDTSALKF